MAFMPAFYRRCSTLRPPVRIPCKSLSDSAATQRRARAWSDYWSSGALHSCAGSYSGNYGGAIADFWRAVFAGLAPQARVLDLCCGNAPLSKLLLEQSDGFEGGIDAVDAARVAPAWIASLPDAGPRHIRVRGEVDARALPFAAAGFDLCMSQYGIEYAGTEAMREVVRVLKPDARFAAVLHHVEALPVRIAREELEHVAWLRQAQGLLESAHGMIEPIARSATPAGQASLRADLRAHAARDRFNASMRELDARVQSATFADVLVEVRDRVAAALNRARAEGEVAARAAWAQIDEGLEANELRQRELVEVALDEAGVRRLLSPLGDPAPHLQVLEFERGGIAGWAVRARRA